MIDTINNNILELLEQESRLEIKKKEHLKRYLEIKQMLQKHKDKIQAIDDEVSRGTIDVLKNEFPFRSPSHIQYIVHGARDASIFRAEEGDGAYRNVATRANRVTSTSQFMQNGEVFEDKYETARLMLRQRGYNVASDRGPSYFYNELFEQQKYKDYRVGSMEIQPDGKIVFGKEQVYGNPERTAPAYAPRPDQERQREALDQPISEPMKPAFHTEKPRPANVIHVTPENYDSIRLPEGYRVHEGGGFIILSTPLENNLVVEGKGYVLVHRQDGSYECRTAERHEHIKGNQERYKKFNQPDIPVQKEQRNRNNKLRK